MEKKISSRKNTSTTNLLLSQAIDFLPDSTFAINLKGKVIFWNRAMEAMTGISAEDMIEKGAYEYSLPFYNERRPILIDLILHPDPDMDKEYTFVRREGDTLYAEAVGLPSKRFLWGKASPIYDNKGKIIGAIESIRDITDKKKTEENLTHTMNTYRAIFENTSSAMVILDEDTTIALMNSEFEQLSGYRRDEVEGKMSWHQFVAAEEIERMQALHELRRKTPASAPGRYEFRFKDRAGAMKEILLTVNIIEGTTKSVASLLDITEWKHAERSLRSSQEKYHDIFLNVSDLLFIHDLKGNFLETNLASKKNTGYTDTDLENMNLQDILPERFKIQFKDFINRLLEKGYDEGLMTIIAKTGEERILEYRSSLILDPEGNPTRVRGSAHDITSRIRTSRQQQKDSEFITSIIQTSPAFYDAIDPKGKVIFMNQAMLNALGYSLPEVVTKDYLEFFIPEEDRADCKDAMERMISSKGPIVHENRVLTKDGRNLLVQWQGKAVFRDNGELEFVFGIGIDVTDQRLLDDALRVSEEKYRKIFENASEGIFQTTSEGRYLSVNPAFARMFGFSSPQEMIESVRDIGKELYVNPKDRDNLVKMLREQGKVEGFEVELYRTDKTTFWISINVHTVCDAQGNILYFEGTNVDISPRKRMDKALRESEEKYRAIFENASEGIYQTTPEGRLLNVNPAFAKMFGFTSPSEMIEKVKDIGKDLYVNPQDREIKLRMLGEQGSVEGFEVEMRRQDKSTIWISISLHTVRDSAGNIAYLEGTNTDITERKGAQEALRSSKEKFSKAFHTNPALMAINTLPDRRFVDVNETFLQTLGYSREEIIGRTVEEIGIFPDAGCFTQATLIFQEQGVLRNYELSVRTKDGHIRSGLFSGDVIKLQDSELWLTVMTDITEKKETEEALRVSEDRFRRMAEVSQEVFWMASPDWRKALYVSPAFEHITGITLDEVYKDPGVWVDLVHPDDMDLVTSVIETLQKQDMEYEFRIILKDGSMRWINNRSSVVKDAQGTILYITGIAEDITERKLSEEERKIYEARLMRSQKLEAIGTLAGGIAHDFNNILSAIIGYSELAIDELPPDSPVSTNIREVLNAGDRAKDLVKQILTFSRQMETERRPVKIHLIIKEALKLLRSSIPSTITITERIDTSTGTVFADSTQIHQVIMNLCTNAYHALLPTGGDLTVSLEQIYLDSGFILKHPPLSEGAHLLITVKDTGSGMDTETLKRIFDPFFTTKEKAKGTGLGLATVHGIVTELGGAILVESWVGKGSTFEIYLPVSQQEQDDMDDLNEEPYPGTSESILLVDDEEAIINFTKAMLSQLGYKVKGICSGIDALNYFRSVPDEIDLVITDQTMPGITGSHLATELLKIRPHLPIILMTGYSETITPEEAVAHGIKEYLDKPFTKNMLVGAIRRSLKG